MSIVGKKHPFELLSEDHCQLLAQQLKLTLHDADVGKKPFHIWFSGDLGSGKTTFIRYLLRSFGHLGKVKSPTYNLCEPYLVKLGPTPLAIHHFDLYRMNHAQEWVEAGFKDIMTAPGLCLIEWPKMAKNTLPTPDLVIHLEYQSEGGRIGHFESHSLEGDVILEALM